MPDVTSQLPTRRRRLLWPAVYCWLALLLAGLGAGCSGDAPNPVGVGLGETQIDTILQALTQSQIEQYGVLDVVVPTAPLDQADVLYLGGTGNDASSILANYDFTVFDHPDSAYLLPYLTPANISTAEIALYLLTWYEPHRGAGAPDPADEDYDPLVKEWTGARKYYDVHALSAPFDTLSFPGPEPAFLPGRLSITEGEPAPAAGPIFVRCNPLPFVAWIAERAQVGVIIREGLGSEPGLLGFASKEMRYGGSTLPPLGAQTILGPALRLRLLQQPAEWPAGRQFLVLRPAADVSTWHQLEDPYTDPDVGIMVRTHLRSYPVVRFDLSQLPPNIRINRANLVVVNDTSRSLGHRTVLTCSEIPSAFVPPGRTTINLADLEPAVFLLAGNGSWEPEHRFVHRLAFNVTTSLQRYVNAAQDSPQGFLLASGETIFPGWASVPGPGFWFTKWVFHGATAPAELRPRLEISYSRIADLDGAKDGP
jgi:hypothetical protein